MKLIAAMLVAILPCLAGPAADKGKILGSPTAPVTIEIFSDFECPMCKTFHEDTLPFLMRDFVVSGKVCIVSREFPLKIDAHKYSRQAANYATAAARIGKYDAVAMSSSTRRNPGAPAAKSGKPWLRSSRPISRRKSRPW